jgi:hypothetical protein
MKDLMSQSVDQFNKRFPNFRELPLLEALAMVQANPMTYKAISFNPFVHCQIAHPSNHYHKK